MSSDQKGHDPTEEEDDLVPAPAWARLLLAAAPFLLGALVLLALRWLS